MPTMLLHNQAFPAEIYTGVWCRQVKNRLLHHSQLTIDDIGLTRLLMVRNATLQIHNLAARGCAELLDANRIISIGEIDAHNEHATFANDWLPVGVIFHVAGIEDDGFLGIGLDRKT